MQSVHVPLDQAGLEGVMVRHTGPIDTGEGRAHLSTPARCTHSYAF